MNVETMEVFCTITGADQRISPQGDPSLEITFDCQFSQFPTRSFCNNSALFYLADAPKPISKMLVLTPSKTKNNKPDDGTFYNYYWNIASESASNGGAPPVTAPAAPWDTPAANSPAPPVAFPGATVVGLSGSAPTAPPPSPAGNTDAMWWSWGDRLRTDVDLQREKAVSIEHQIALKEARLATEWYLTTVGETAGHGPWMEGLDPSEGVAAYIETVGKIYQGFTDLLMS